MRPETSTAKQQGVARRVPQANTSNRKAKQKKPKLIIFRNSRSRHSMWWDADAFPGLLDTCVWNSLPLLQPFVIS